MLSTTRDTFYRDELGIELLHSFFRELKEFEGLAWNLWLNLLKRQWQDVVDGANKLLSLVDDEPFLYVVRGYAYLQVGDFKSGEADFTNAINLDYHSALVYTLRGFVLLLASGDTERAIEDFNQALEVKRFNQAFAGRGLARANSGHYAEAIPDLSIAVKSKLMLPLTLNARGFSYTQLKNYRNALKDFERLRGLLGDKSAVLNNLAFVYFQEKRLDQAETFWARASQMEDAQSFIHAGYAITLWILQKPELAARQFELAINKDAAWRDDLLEMVEKYYWTTSMLKIANEIRQYLYTNSISRNEYARITSNPDRLGGAPTIRDMRLAVETVARMVASGATEAEILSQYPELEPEDIQEAVRFAAENPLLIDAQV
jgi:uncharacterized protein (DUF433 family)/tetratricopeptide (TPR) repeat protein